MIKTIMRKVRVKASGELSVALPSDFWGIFNGGMASHVSLEYDNNHIMQGLTLKVVK